MIELIDIKAALAHQALLHHCNVDKIIDAAETFRATAYPRPAHFEFVGAQLIDSEHIQHSAWVSQDPLVTLVLDAAAVKSNSRYVILDDKGLENEWDLWLKTTKEVLRPIKNSVSAGVSTAPGARRTQRIAAIQGALGLSLQDLARVFNISRPGLYKWLDMESEVRMQDASRSRFDQVERLSQEWLLRSTTPLASMAREPLASGQTLLELLADAQIDEGLVLRAFDEIVGRLNTRPLSRSERLAAKGFTRRTKALLSDE